MEKKPVRKSIKKRTFRFVLNLVLVFLSVPLALTFLFRDPMVQTVTARIATHYLSSKTNYDIRISTIKVNISDGIVMTHVHVNDHHGNAMIKLDRLAANLIFADFGLIGFRFASLKLDGAEFRYKRYIEDEAFNLMLFLNSFSSTATTATTDKVEGKTGSFKLRAHKLLLTNGVFQFYDEHKNYENDGMDYADIVFKDIFLDATNFSIVNDSINAQIDSLRTIEKSGLTVGRMSTQFSISRSGLRATDLLMETEHSTLDLDLEFETKSYKTFAFFIDSVVMHGNFRPTSIRMSDIKYFSDIMAPMENNVGVTGQVDGTVADLTGKNLRLHFAQDTRFFGNAQITGLPDFFTSRIDAEIFEFTTTSCDLRSFSLPIEERNLDYTKEFDCKDPIFVNGTFKGSYYDFNSKLNIDTQESHLEADIDYNQVGNDTIYFVAKLKGDTINIGKLIDQENTLGYTNLDLVVEGFGNTIDDIYLKADGLFKSMDLLDYNYQRIGVDIDYFGDTVFANIRVGDKHLMMRANGKMSISDKPLLIAKADIKRADIDDLNLWIGTDLRIAAKADVLIKDFDFTSMRSKIKLTDGIINFGPDQYKLAHALLEKYEDENDLNVLKLNSDIADFEMIGKYDLEMIPEQIIAMLNRFYDAFPQNEESLLATNEFADISLHLKKSNLIEEQFLSGLELFPPFDVTAYFDVHNNIIELHSSNEKLAYLGTVFNKNVVDVKTQKGKLIFNFSADNVVVMDSTETDKTVFGVDLLNFGFEVEDNKLDFGIDWENKNAVNLNYGHIQGNLSNISNTTNFTINKSDIYINDTLWSIDENNRIVSDTTGLYFYNVNIFGGVSELSLFGKYPQQDYDSLNLAFNQWNLSNFDFITAISNYDIDGIINGQLNVSIIGEVPTIVSNLTIDSLHLNHEYLGTASLLNTWDNENNSIFIESKIIRKGTSGEGEVFAVNGLYYPFRTDESIDLSVDFNRFKLKAIEPFIDDFVSSLEGQASGGFLINGSVEKPVITGIVDLRRTAMVINYLNTKYSFSNEIVFEPDRISFDELVIYDTLGNFANVDGSLMHNYFDKPNFDIAINTEKLLFFNTTSKMNELYYGTAITSGKILISGSPRNVKLKMDVQTQSGTDVSIPLDYSAEISDKDYIIFVEHIDSLDLLAEELEGKAKIKEEELDYDVNLGMKITPQARVTIFMPSDMGRIESEGSGDLKMSTNSSGDFSLKGDYIVSDGLFHFSLGSLVNKRFELVRGGRISWSGDPYTAIVGLSGLYKVRTSLAGLNVPDSSRVNVECYIHLSNQLLNPDIRFEIKFPDLDLDQQRMVYADLDTTNMAVMNEQMISLLVLGTFSASNASNITLASSYYSVLTNQLSSMLSRISDDFDVGINYKPGENLSEEEFEVALSTQLFDDRLIIDGNFGMTYDKVERNNSNIVGDVDLGYKLTEDGRWILKAFNHSNVNSWYNSYYKVAPYTQGVGIAFRKEFSNIAELFRKTKSKKVKNDKEKDDEL